jgi:hypothetical protein
LLYTYMDFIDRAGQLLKTRLGNRLQFRKQLDSHPKAGARLERLDLMNLGELPYTSVVLRYAKEFFDSVFEHANRLDDQALFESLHEQS